jgi:hypothetical protein
MSDEVEEAMSVSENLAVQERDMRDARNLYRAYRKLPSTMKKEEQIKGKEERTKAHIDRLQGFLRSVLGRNIP